MYYATGYNSTKFKGSVFGNYDNETVSVNVLLKADGYFEFPLDYINKVNSSIYYRNMSSAVVITT